MMHRIVDKLSCALFDSDLISTRLTLAMAELLWCFMLLWPGDTFTRPTYDVMSDIAGETWWAAFFGISSILQFAVVLRNDFQANWARLFAMWNASLWVVSVGAMIISVYPPPAAIGGEIALMVAALWIWVRPLILERGVLKNVG